MRLYAKIGEMVWPCPGRELDDVEYSLRHGTPTRSQLMVAASVMAAYRQMILDTAKKRAYVVRSLRVESLTEKVKHDRG